MDIYKVDHSKANNLWERALNNIMDGTYIYSKMPYVSVYGVSPIYFKKGKGTYAWDLDGNKYLDLSAGIGPCILGYNNDFVNQAAIEQLKDGIIFSLPHPIEVEAAELLNEIIPNSGLVRFMKSGSEVNLAAIRIARAYTGREKIICSSFHGWHDWSISITPKAKGIQAGISKNTFRAKYNDINTFKELFDKYKDEIAAVILEPIEFEVKDNFLQSLVELAHSNGALVIFDEVVTGFRFSLGGAQEFLNITPDISTFGKAMANGFPLAAVIGKKEIIQKVKDEIFVSTTYGGECLSLAAFVANVKFIRENNVYAHINNIGKQIKDGLNEISKKYGSNIKCIGLPPRLNFVFENSKGEFCIKLKTLFLQELIKRGVYYVWTILPNFAMTDSDVKFLVNVFDDCIRICTAAEKNGNIDELIEGEYSKMPL